MSNKVALLNCTFGWGKICRLYEDSIEIAGKPYKLGDLTSVHPTYRNILGIPSARLELSFGLHRLVLRGIADLETARRLVSHLITYCSVQTIPERHHSGSVRTHYLIRAQAKTWERTNKLPTIPRSPEKSLLDPRLTDRLEPPTRPLTVSRPLSLAESYLFESDEESRFAQTLPTLTGALDVSEQPTSILVSCWSPPELFTVRSQSIHIPHLQPPLHPVHLVDPAQKRQASCQMPAVSVLAASVCPVIRVPVRLQPGEYAHYSSDATLCGDRVSDSEQAMYPPLDYGLLILTNRRIFYVGKLSQFVLPYTHFWYVSLVRNAIALHIKRQFRRIIIEVEHAQEWAGRINQLAFVAQYAPIKPVHIPLSTSALLRLKPPSYLDVTLKSPAVKAPAATLALDTDLEVTLKRSTVKAPATSKDKVLKTDLAKKG